jgi:RND family efflux transporter MFP subunit
VAAPLNGTLKAPSGGVPRAGARVKKGDAVFQFLPLLSGDAKATLAAARVEAEGQINNARVQLAAARIALDRAKDLFQSEAGSRRAVDDAQAQFDVAQKTLDAAQARFALLTQVGDPEKGTAAPIAIEAPTDGLLRTVNALAEQNVPAGAALFEVVNLDPMWVRVPVFVGEAAELHGETAAVGPLAARAGTPTQTARAVSAPPSANPMAGTVDLFFTLPNPDGKVRPGERVGVTIHLKDAGESLTVPWSAVILDIHGGTWVYEQTAPQTYVRRRVQVRHVVEGTAVLQTGPPAGTRVVAVGAQELFGTEVGFGK